MTINRSEHKLFSVQPSVQNLFFNFNFPHPDLDVKAQLADKGYHAEDQHESVVAVALNYTYNNEEFAVTIPEEVNGVAVPNDLRTDFILELQHSTTTKGIALVCKDGILTVQAPDFPGIDLEWLDVRVSTRLYLGEFSPEDIPANPELYQTQKDIVEMSKFLTALNVPVFAHSGLDGQQSLPSPFTGLVNEAVHAARDWNGLDNLLQEGGVPETIVTFLNETKVGKINWFYDDMEKHGHFVSWEKFDMARKWALVRLTQPCDVMEHDVYVTLYQLFAYAVNDITANLREPFFRHVRSLARQYSDIFQKTPSMNMIVHACYDADYLNIYAGLITGTENYIDLLENKARNLLEQEWATAAAEQA